LYDVSTSTPSQTAIAVLPLPTPTPPPTGPAVMLSPVPGATFHSSTVTFEWSPGTASSYRFQLGNSAGAADIYDSGPIPAISVTLSGLPTDGRPIYAKLTSVVDGKTTTYYYSYVAYTSTGATPTPTPTSSPG